MRATYSVKLSLAFFTTALLGAWPGLYLANGYGRLLVLLFLGLAAGAGALLARRLTQPVRQILDAARILADGDLSVTLPVRSRDELGELAGQLNRLVQHQRELVQALDGHTRSVVEASEQLSLASEQAASAAQGAAQSAASMAQNVTGQASVEKDIRATVHSLPCGRCFRRSIRLPRLPPPSRRWPAPPWRTHGM